MADRKVCSDFGRFLPRELLERVAFMLDPKSIKSLSATSKILRERLAEAGDSFWQKYVGLWEVPLPPKLKHHEHDDPDQDGGDLDGGGDSGAEKGDGGNVVGRNDVGIWARLVRSALSRCNIVSGAGKMWLCQWKAGKEAVLEDDREDQTPPLFVVEDIPQLRIPDWGGSFAAAPSPNCPFLVWRTYGASDDPPKQLEVPPGAVKEEPMFGTLVVWRDRVLFSPKVRVDEDVKDLTLLRIYDVKNWSRGTSVKVPIEVDFEWEDETLFEVIKLKSWVGILETDDGTAKAVVIHFRLPRSIYIVKIPEGTLERKIPLASPFEFGVSCNVVNHRPNFTSSLVMELAFQDSYLDDRKFDYQPCLTVTATSASETRSEVQLVKKDGDEGIVEVDVSPEGAVFAVVEIGDPNYDFDFDMIYSTYLRVYNFSSTGDLMQAAEEREVRERHLCTAESAGLQKASIVINHDFKIVVTALNLFDEIDTTFYLTRYSLDPEVALEVVRDDITTQADVRGLATCSDRFVAVCFDKATGGYFLAFHDIKTGEKIAEKKLHLTGEEQKEADLRCLVQMSLSDVMVTFSKKNGDVIFLLVRY